MASQLQNLINGRLGVGFAMAFGRLLPPGAGRRLGDALADRLAARGGDIVQAVRANQWVATGERLEGTALALAVRDTFRHAARCLYDLYHHLHDPAALQALLAVDPAVDTLLAQARQGGLILVSPHLSNFDLVGRALALRGLRAQVLSFPEPGGGYRWQNELRRRAGMEITPASGEAIKQAVRRLQAGGVVATGADRPVPDGRYRPHFFGRPAAVPLIHVTLAQRTGAPMLVVGARRGEDGRYRVLLSDLIPLQPHPDRRTELLRNAEAVLQVVEGFIRQAPEQWLMFYPVWPEVVQESAV